MYDVKSVAFASHLDALLLFLKADVYHAVANYVDSASKHHIMIKSPIRRSGGKVMFTIMHIYI